MANAKKPPIKKILSAADLYAENLLNRNVLLLGSHDNMIETFELRFLAENFKHLTGVRTVSRDVSPKQFWRMCRGHNLSERDLAPDYEGWAGLKLKVAPYVFDSGLSAREFGRANGARLRVDADVYSGDHRVSLGFSLDEGGYCYPKSLLMSSVRSEVKRDDLFRVIGVFSKPVKSRWYDLAVRVDSEADWDYVCQSLPPRLQHVTTIRPQCS